MRHLPDVERNELKKQMEKYQAERIEKIASDSQGGAGFFDYEKKGIQKGVCGGLTMMAIAFVWFFGGLCIGIIFFYPPILFIIGLYSFVKGMATGNFSGRKEGKQHG